MQYDVNKEVVIRPRRGLIGMDFKELIEFRDLLTALVERNVKARYKQSVLGVAWVVIKPIISMAIFSVLFGKMARFPSEGIPYPIFVFLGLIPWTYFSNSVSGGTGSLISNGSLISKIYFPRVMLPMATNISNMIDLGISLVVLMIMIVFFKLQISAGVIFLPVLIVAFFFSALGPAFFFGALNVKYRDVGQIISFIMQIWMYLTPVIYPLTLIPEQYRMLAYLNPMTGLIEVFRVCMLGHMDLSIPGLMLSTLVNLVFLVGGLMYFKSVERTFADVI